MLEQKAAAAIANTNWWDALTPAQGSVISGAFTFLAAILGVLLGWKLLSGKVKDLKSAVEASEGVLTDHAAKMEKVLSEVQDKVGALDAQLTSTTESLGQLRGAVGDLQSVASPVENADKGGADREALREAWEKIRDNLERIAADPAIDGRTRAKYSRLDRRRYRDLVEALDRDGRLGGSVQRYREAVDLWLRHRNGRQAVTDEACRQMNGLWDAVRPAE